MSGLAAFQHGIANAKTIQQALAIQSAELVV